MHSRLAFVPILLLFCGCSSVGKLSPLAPLERALVFQPVPLAADYAAPASASIEEISFQSGDATKLHGWYINHSNPVAVALFCHGNAGNVSDRLDRLITMSREHRLAIFAFDYRGYGKSEGKPTELGVLEDARAARKWLAGRTALRQQDIVLIGRSLGGAVAVDLAARDGARGLILESTFTSLPAVASHHWALLPARFLMTHRLDSLKKIPEYDGSLLCSHGDADEVIPIVQGKQLFEAANGPKDFVTITGGTHNSPPTEEYKRAFSKYLASLPDSNGPPAQR